jgi:hypothetical protein
MARLVGVEIPNEKRNASHALNVGRGTKQTKRIYKRNRC